MKQLEEVKTERKRCYVSTYGMECWDDNLIGLEREVKEQNNLEFICHFSVKLCHLLSIVLIQGKVDRVLDRFSFDTNPLKGIEQ